MLRNRAARFMTHELAFSQGYVRTPGGFRHKSYVHRVRPGQAVTKRAGVSELMDTQTKELIEMPPPTASGPDLSGLGGGWVTWAGWTNASGQMISRFATSWTVPPAPKTQSGQLIYFFNALEDQAGKDILQPVLQWGTSGAGGGSYWSVASWYVDSAKHAFCTEVVQVNEGDKVTGIMTAVVQADASIHYTSEFQGISGTGLVADGLSQLVSAYETLEVYTLKQCSDYPNTAMTAMAAIDLQLMGNPASNAAVNPAGFNWAPGAMDNPTCGEHATVVSNVTPGGEVDLYY